jgi:hypothetical protein
MNGQNEIMNRDHKNRNEADNKTPKEQFLRAMLDNETDTAMIWK